MKVIIEIENDDELKKVQKLLHELDIHSTVIKPSLTSHKKEFLQFIQSYSSQLKPVKKIAIPSREERNE